MPDRLKKGTLRKDAFAASNFRPESIQEEMQAARHGTRAIVKGGKGKKTLRARDRTRLDDTRARRAEQP